MGSLMMLMQSDIKKALGYSTMGQMGYMVMECGLGAFSLAMIGEYQEALFTYGAWFYRRLFWEAGLIGQVLYLEAEAAGVRATGIGCYFDDPVHDTFGIGDLAYQSLYHFTVGGAVEDLRLTTLAPYGTSTDEQERGIDRP